MILGNTCQPDCDKGYISMDTIRYSPSNHITCSFSTELQLECRPIPCNVSRISGCELSNCTNGILWPTGGPEGDGCIIDKIKPDVDAVATARNLGYIIFGAVFTERMEAVSIEYMGIVYNTILFDDFIWYVEIPQFNSSASVPARRLLSSSVDNAKSIVVNGQDLAGNALEPFFYNISVAAVPDNSTVVLNTTVADNTTIPALFQIQAKWQVVKQLYHTNGHNCGVDDTSKACPNKNLNLETWTCTQDNPNIDQKIVDASTLTFEKLKHLYNAHHCGLRGTVCANQYLNVTSWECVATN